MRGKSYLMLRPGACADLDNHMAADCGLLHVYVLAWDDSLCCAAVTAVVVCQAIPHVCMDIVDTCPISLQKYAIQFRVSDGKASVCAQTGWQCRMRLRRWRFSSSSPLGFPRPAFPQPSTAITSSRAPPPPKMTGPSHLASQVQVREDCTCCKSPIGNDLFILHTF